MKIIYAADIRLPTSKAHGIQIMKTCEALVNAGHEVVLIIAAEGSGEQADILEHYHVGNGLVIEKVSRPALLSWGKLGFLIRSYLFARRAEAFLRGRTFDAVYTRDELVAYFLSGRTRGVFYEIHDARNGFLQRRAIASAAGIVAITEGLRKYGEKNGASDICVVPDAVDFDKFALDIDGGSAQKKIGLPSDKKIVLYAGHLYEWKGVNILAAAAAMLPQNVLTVFVGGNPWDVDSFRAKNSGNKHILILGPRSHDMVPFYLAAADVLVLPNSAREDISRLYTSPLKLFEYMAARRPIVAADLPSIREILNEERAFLVRPDDPSALAEGIKYVLDNDDKAAILRDRAFDHAKKFTWRRRAELIADFLEKKQKRT